MKDAKLIDGQTILAQGRTPNMTGHTLALFLTFDGTWYRVRTRLETLTRVRREDRARAAYQSALVAP